jgi:hypothetical protein
MIFHVAPRAPGRLPFTFTMSFLYTRPVTAEVTPLAPTFTIRAWTLPRSRVPRYVCIYISPRPPFSSPPHTSSPLKFLRHNHNNKFNSNSNTACSTCEFSSTSSSAWLWASSDSSRVNGFALPYSFDLLIVHSQIEVRRRHLVQPWQCSRGSVDGSRCRRHGRSHQPGHVRRRVERAPRSLPVHGCIAIAILQLRHAYDSDTPPIPDQNWRDRL